jgi:hypothetical protein
MEKFGVEVSRIIHEAAVTASHSTSTRAGWWMLRRIVLFQVEAIGRDFFMQIEAFQYDIPEFLEVIAAWSLASHAYNQRCQQSIWIDWLD